ncbi:type I-U CRISPR-associated protein Cas5/Cas6 [bacterium]|nr:type I-U CRISPR-associated protein Cas5/Cas6 [bacterium]
MATVLQFRFPGGRYHATPWGHHVNEGLVEWPPSPWRILRALLATGFCKARWDASHPPVEARNLVEALASQLPSYWLPPVALGHSRHYVDAAGKKPLILDAWARVAEPEGMIEISWDIDLPLEQRQMLGQLVEWIGYLGRAESWVEGCLIEATTRPPNCFPGRDDGTPDRGFEAVRVLCPQDVEAYRSWRQRAVAPIEATLTLPADKKASTKLLKEREKSLSPYPADLIAALCTDTGWLQMHGWSAPPGSRQVLYWRRTDALAIGPPVHIHKAKGTTVKMALLALATSSRNRSALPTLQRTYPQGRLLHKALAATLQRASSPQAALVLLGRDRDRFADQHHQHAHLLHLDLDEDGRLDHALVWAPAGLDPDAQQVLRMVRKTWTKGGAGELQVALAGLGDAETLRGAGDQLGRAISAAIGPSGGAREWISATPFVAPRFTKKRGKDSLEAQIGESLARRNLPPAQIEILDLHCNLRLSFRHFILHDSTHAPPVPMGHAVRLTFHEPVRGPICLGYGSHCGLGRFDTVP